MLRVGGGAAAAAVPKATPVAPSGRKSSASGTPGVGIDDGALKRQQQHVQAGVNGHTSVAADGSRSPVKPAATLIPAPNISAGSAQSAPPSQSPDLGPSAVKHENGPVSTSRASSSSTEPPRMNGTHPTTAGSSMPPPNVNSGTTVNGTHAPLAPPPQPYVPPPPPVTAFDSKFRQPGKCRPHQLPWTSCALLTL